MGARLGRKIVLVVEFSQTLERSAEGDHRHLGGGECYLSMWSAINDKSGADKIFHSLVVVVVVGGGGGGGDKDIICVRNI
jgi:hypothetical protein